MKSTSHPLLLLALGASLSGCGIEVEPSGYKMVGVGANPDEVAPTPTMYSGLVSYDWISFSGAALPLGLAGLVAFDGVGPTANDPYEPPFSLVLASGLVMDSDLPATDVLFGSFGVAPTVVGRCHTIYEPTSYVGGLADVGSAITLETADGSAGFSIGRRPLMYPTDAQDVFPTYSELGAWREVPRYYRTAPDRDAQDIGAMEEAVLTRPNYPFGEQVEVKFPGAIPPAEATFSSIPVPSAAGNLSPHVLPTRPEGVLMTWSGPQYSSDGIELSSGEVSTCLSFLGPDAAPTSAADCLSVASPGEPVDDQYPGGQMYTAPWETDDGITFRWVVSESDVDQVVSITVRLLGPVDEDDDNLVEAVVPVRSDSDTDRAWEVAQSGNAIPSSAPVPSEGYRPATVCDADEDFSYRFEDSLRQGDGYIASLQGSPLRTMAELVCNVGDEPVDTATLDGAEYGIAEFTITADMMEDAIAYGRTQGAMGAIFYFNRTTKTPMDFPDVRDFGGKKRNTSDVLVLSNAALLGRFWVGDGI